MTQCLIDHVVLLVSSADYENLPVWINDNFTVVVGGKHQGQSSRNKLIVFEDGTYLELFNWFDSPPSADDEKQPMRVWGQKQPGLIHFVLSSKLSTSALEYVDSLNHKLVLKDGGLGVSYRKPFGGRRVRGDGVELEWTISDPIYKPGSTTPDESYFPKGRLDAPFFCHDVTDRLLRVPADDRAITTHHCGARGISEIELMVPSDSLTAYSDLYSTLTASQPEQGGDDQTVAFIVGLPTDKMATGKLVIRTPHTEAEEAMMSNRGVGISRIVISGRRGIDNNAEAMGSDEIGSSVLIA